MRRRAGRLKSHLLSWRPLSVRGLTVRAAAASAVSADRPTRRSAQREGAIEGDGKWQLVCDTLLSVVRQSIDDDGGGFLSQQPQST